MVWLRQWIGKDRRGTDCSSGRAGVQVSSRCPGQVPSPADERAQTQLSLWGPGTVGDRKVAARVEEKRCVSCTFYLVYKHVLPLLNGG